VKRRSQLSVEQRKQLRAAVRQMTFGLSMPPSMGRKVEEILEASKTSGERVSHIVARFAQVAPIFENGTFVGRYKPKKEEE
jgi:hypothetical protein